MAFSVATNKRSIFVFLLIVLYYNQLRFRNISINLLETFFKHHSLSFSLPCTRDNFRPHGSPSRRPGPFNMYNSEQQPSRRNKVDGSRQAGTQRHFKDCRVPRRRLDYHLEHHRCCWAKP